MQRAHELLRIVIVGLLALTCAVVLASCGASAATPGEVADAGPQTSPNAEEAAEAQAVKRLAANRKKEEAEVAQIRKRDEAQDAAAVHTPTNADRPRSSKHRRQTGKPARRTSGQPTASSPNAHAQKEAEEKQSKAQAEELELSKQQAAEQAAALASREKREAAEQRQLQEEAAARYVPVGAVASGPGQTPSKRERAKRRPPRHEHKKGKP